MTRTLTHLERLEAEAIHIMRKSPLRRCAHRQS
ncbi:MAG: hypothetical protein RLZZ58_2197 [Pseudomonadota bacterium]